MSNVQTLRREGHSVSANLISSAVPMARALTNHPLVGADAASSKPARLHSMIGVAGLLALGAVAGCGSSPSPTQVDDPVDSGVTQMDTGVVPPRPCSFDGLSSVGTFPAQGATPAIVQVHNGGLVGIRMPTNDEGITVNLNVVFDVSIRPIGSDGNPFTQEFILTPIHSCPDIGTFYMYVGEQAQVFNRNTTDYNSPNTHLIQVHDSNSSDSANLILFTNPSESLWAVQANSTVHPPTSAPQPMTMIGSSTPYTISAGPIGGVPLHSVSDNSFGVMSLLSIGSLDAYPVQVLATERDRDSPHLYYVSSSHTVYKIYTSEAGRLSSVHVQVRSYGIPNNLQ